MYINPQTAMEKNKLILVIISSILICTATHSQVQFGSGIDTNFDSFGLSIKAKYELTTEWGVQAGFSWFLNNSNPSRVDLDAKYLLTTTGDNDDIDISGLGGFNYWSSGVPGAGGELGINIGGNFAFPINDRSYYIEPRLTLISNAALFVGFGTYF